MKNTCYIILFVWSSFLVGCGGGSSSPDLDPTPTPPPVEDNGIEEMEKIKVPEKFEFNTQGGVTLTLKDAEGTFYWIYAVEDDLNQTESIDYVDDSGKTIIDNFPVRDEFSVNEIGSAYIPASGSAKIHLTVATNVSTLLLHKKIEDCFFSSTIDIGTQRPETYTHEGEPLKPKGALLSKSTKEALAKDVLWCVNGSGQCFTVNPETREVDYKRNLDEGTWTVGMDFRNHQFYTIGRSSPYKLYRYDVDVDNNYEVSNPVVIKELGFGGPRLEYANDEGFLYFSTRREIYKIDPNTGDVLNKWNIDSGLNNTSGGDIAKDTEGNWYMSTFGGLYFLTFTEGSSTVKAVRKSADNLGFTPTSLCVDSKVVPDLWVASNHTPSPVYVMDRETGGMQKYDPKYDQDKQFAINDLTKTPIVYENIGDSDGDGVPDDIDAYPNDPEVSSRSLSPTKYGWGTIAFEDLWPSRGDYDFNDLVINYRHEIMQNAENMVVKMRCKFWVCRVKGASFSNMFGFQFDNLTPADIERVSGYDIRGNKLTIDSKGLEANQEKAVVMVFDDSHYYRNETSEAKEGVNVVNMDIKFTTPLDPEELGTAPFNPFIVANGNGETGVRGREVHLPDYAATSLGETGDFGTTNVDPDGDYRTDSGLSWAICIVHQFKFPKERKTILKAYNHFKTWCESGGSSFSDWYKDNSGYRNTENIHELGSD